jgi:hypothetical protein
MAKRSGFPAVPNKLDRNYDEPSKNDSVHNSLNQAVWQTAATKGPDNCEQNSSDVDQIPATPFCIASHRSDEKKDADQPSKSADEADDQMHSGVPRRNHGNAVCHQGWE